jgi:hypothetical protein
MDYDKVAIVGSGNWGSAIGMYYSVDLFFQRETQTVWLTRLLPPFSDHHRQKLPKA